MRETYSELTKRKRHAISITLDLDPDRTMHTEDMGKPNCEVLVRLSLVEAVEKLASKQKLGRLKLTWQRKRSWKVGRVLVDPLVSIGVDQLVGLRLERSQVWVRLEQSSNRRGSWRDEQPQQEKLRQSCRWSLLAMRQLR